MVCVTYMQDMVLSHLYLLHRLGFDTQPYLTGLEVSSFHQFMESFYGPPVLFLLIGYISITTLVLFGHSLREHIVFHV